MEKRINDFIKDLQNNKKNVKNFPELLNLSNNFNRHIDLSDIDEEIADTIETIIKFWNKADDEQGLAQKDREPIKIYINSPGGSLHAAFTIIDAINLSKTPVYTINMGTAYSAGLLIFINGHRRIAYPHSSFLFHEGSISMGAADAGKFRNYADFYNRQLNVIKNIMIEKTKISEEEYEKIKKDDSWFLIDEALELGLCDEIAKEFIY